MLGNSASRIVFGATSTWSVLRRRVCWFRGSVLGWGRFVCVRGIVTFLCKTFSLCNACSVQLCTEPTGAGVLIQKIYFSWRRRCTCVNVFRVVLNRFRRAWYTVMTRAKSFGSFAAFQRPLTSHGFSIIVRVRGTVNFAIKILFIHLQPRHCCTRSKKFLLKVKNKWIA